jgi:hypothetical protein
VLPIAHNAGYLWPKGLFGKRPGTLTVSIGKPIRSSGKDAQTLMAEVEDWIEAEVARLGRPKACRVNAAAHAPAREGARGGRPMIARLRCATSSAARVRTTIGRAKTVNCVASRSRRAGRLPARPRATAHDRHADRAVRVTVRAPRWVPIREIEAALAERDAWVVRSLAEWRARRRDVLPARGNRRLDSLPRTRARARRPSATQEGNRSRSHQSFGAASCRATTSARSRRSSDAGCAMKPCGCSSHASPTSPRA